jgi:hypothetical protein
MRGVLRLEVSLEKLMLTVIALCFASMICIPLIEGGVRQARYQFEYSHFEMLISSIDNGIAILLNSTGQKAIQADLYIPSEVAVNSSMTMVTYYFTSDSITTSIRRDYPINVDVSFNYSDGWYNVNMELANSTWIRISFAEKAGS